MKYWRGTIALFIFVFAIILGWFYWGRMPLYIESEHFKLYSTFRDKKCLEDLNNSLEKSFEIISEELDFTYDKKKIEVKVYSNQNNYNHSNRHGTWTDGFVISSTAQFEDIRMLSPLYEKDMYDYDEAIKNASHSLVHFLMKKKYGDINKMQMWLTEGVATYIIEKDNDNFKEKLKDLADKNEVLDYGYFRVYHGKNNLFIKGIDHFTEINGYHYSYVMIEYIINNYGKEKLFEICLDYTNYYSILGFSTEEEFFDACMEYLKQKY